MAYATLAEMLGRHNRTENPELTQLTALPGAAGPDETRIAQALDEASGQMDVYFGSRYDVPVSGLSDAQSAHLSQMCSDIARYRLWDDRASEEVRTRYEDALRFLEQVAAGKVHLGGGSGGSSGGAKASIKSGTRLFTRDTQQGVF